MIIGSNVIHYEKVSSTNTLAAEMLRAGRPPEGTVITASYQEAGKGQKGNRWVSEPGKNLLMSVILYPGIITPAEQFIISQMVSLAVFDLVSSETPNVKIKWPNDIYVMNDKIAGILIEHSILGNSIDSTIAGIGLNVNQDVFTGAGPNPISLKLLTGKKYDLPVLAANLAGLLDTRYEMIRRGETARLADEYHAALYRRGEWHLYSDNEGSFMGKITRVEPDGQLIIMLRNGREKGYAFREIDYIP